MKKLLWGLTLLILLVPLVSATPLPLTIEQVEIDGFDITNSQFRVERGENIEFKVKFRSAIDLENIDIHLDVNGYKYQAIHTSKHLRTIDANDSEGITLQLDLPDDVEDDFYSLRLTISNRIDRFEQEYKLHIDQADTLVSITDIIINPANNIKAGGSLLAFARVENKGEQKEKNVRITVSIPDLGQSQTGYINDIDVDEEEESPELLLRIPRCADSGVYDIVVEAQYDNRRETVKKSQIIQIKADDSCTTKGPTSVVTGLHLATIAQGQGIMFPFTITNGEPTPQAYTIMINGLESWANAQISPSNTLLIDGGEQETFYVFTTANSNAQEGPKTFTATIQSNGKVLEQISLTANVVKTKNAFSTAQKVLGVILVALLIILIIVVVMLNIEKSNNKKYY
jgi:uncharacterized membrane protein